MHEYYSAKDTSVQSEDYYDYLASTGHWFLSVVLVLVRRLCLLFTNALVMYLFM